MRTPHFGAGCRESKVAAMLDLSSPSALEFEQNREERASSLHRLAILLGLAEGAWAFAVFEDGAVQRELVLELRTVLAPLPVLDVSFLKTTPDPLAIVASSSQECEHPAPVLSFTAVEAAFPALFGYLDLQREALARRPHRLLFWVNEYELRQLAERAPNFYSRLSGIFRFPGRVHDRGVPSPTPPQTTKAISEATSGLGRRRPYVKAGDETHRRRQIEVLQKRIRDLRNLPRPDPAAIGDAWYDLAGLFEGALPRQWSDAEAAYAEAARAYASAGMYAWQAEALYQAGDAARRAYAHRAALDYLEDSLTLYRLHSGGPPQTPDMFRGEANVLKAQGDVLAFLKQNDEALQRYDQALSLFRAVGARLGEANVLQAQGDVLAFLDQRQEALQRYDQALSLFRAVGDRLGEANVLKAQGALFLGEGDVEQGMAKLEAAHSLYEKVGDRVGLANVGITLADHAASRGDLAAAIRYLQPAADFGKAIGHPLGDQLEAQINAWQQQLAS